MQYTEFKKYAKLYESLHKNELKFNINFITIPSYMISETNNPCNTLMVPKFLEVDKLSSIADIFQNLHAPVPRSYMELGTAAKKLVCGLPMMTSNASAEKVTSELAKSPNSPVKYFSAALDKKYLNNINLSSYGLFDFRHIYLIKAPPLEQMEKDKTYRLLTDSGSNVIACVDHSHKLYKYLDKGHVLVFAPDKKAEVPYIVTNQLTLDVCCLIGLYQIYSDKISEVLQDGIFLRAGDARIALFKAEKALPDRFHTEYQKLKAGILKDFENSAQAITLNKLQRGELTDIVLNDIKIRKNKVEYENVSIESDLLGENVFNKLDGTAQFNIYDILTILANDTENWLGTRPTTNHIGENGRMNQAMRFDKNYSRTIKVNGMEIVASVKDTCSARYVNGIRINHNEIARVLNRATCYHDINQYNLFLKEVNKLSLAAHDLLINGQTVKLNQSAYDDYHAAKGGVSQPKFKYSRGNDGEYLLHVGDNDKVKLHRFVTFLHDIAALNLKANNGYIGYGHPDQNEFKHRDANWLKAKITTLILHHSVKSQKDNPTIKIPDFKDYFKWIKDTQALAELKAKKLLEDTMLMVGATHAYQGDMEGYEVKGNIKTYFIDKKTNRVFDTKSKQNICIVNGKAEMGIGADAVVALLLALKNDSRRVDAIQTLKL